MHGYVVMGKTGSGRANQAGFVDGPRGETLFHKPFFLYFRHDPTPELLKKTQKIDYDRLLAVVSSLIVEDRLNAALSAFMPRYKVLDESEDYTFSMKIKLMRALNFIPTRLLSAADEIRKVRNEFAHNLELERFDQFKTKSQTRMRGLWSCIYPWVGKDLASSGETLRSVFHGLAFFAIVGLDAYANNLAFLRKYISKPAVIDAMRRQVESENEKALQDIKARGPTSTELRNGLRIQRYPQGVVTIGLVEPTTRKHRGPA